MAIPLTEDVRTVYQWPFANWYSYPLDPLDLITAAVIGCNLSVNRPYRIEYLLISGQFGSLGTPGTIGFQGATGATGRRGFAGQPGQPGSTGLMGLAGDTGLPGMYPFSHSNTRTFSLEVAPTTLATFSFCDLER